MLFTVREVDVLRLLCWCQNVKPEDLNKISTETERENLIALGFAKLHERSGTLTITESGKAFLHVLLEGEVPNLAFSYRPELIERRVRLCYTCYTSLSNHYNRTLRAFCFRYGEIWFHLSMQPTPASRIKCF